MTCRSSATRRPPRDIADGRSSESMAAHYQHVTDAMRSQAALQVGELIWATAGPAAVMVSRCPRRGQRPECSKPTALHGRASGASDAENLEQALPHSFLALVVEVEEGGKIKRQAVEVIVVHVHGSLCVG